MFVSLDRTGVGTGRFAAASQARLAFGRWPGSEGEQEAAAAAASSSTLISSALNPPQAPHTSVRKRSRASERLTRLLSEGVAKAPSGFLHRQREREEPPRQWPLPAWGLIESVSSPHTSRGVGGCCARRGWKCEVALLSPSCFSGSGPRPPPPQQGDFSFW